LSSLLLALWIGAAGISPAAVKVLQQHQCARCHVVEGVKSPPKELSCSGCHLDISGAEGNAERMVEGREHYGATWERFVQKTGEHYVHIPSLTAMHRFQASWLRSFLLAPSDMRPNLGESMIRHNLTDAEIETLVKGWGAKDAAPVTTAAAVAPDRIAAGAKLFESKGCTACHVFGRKI